MAPRERAKPRPPSALSLWVWSIVVWAVQRVVVAVLTTLELAVPSAGGLAKAAKQARLLKHRGLYTLCNAARCAVLQGHRILGRPVPPFGTSYDPCYGY